MSAREHSSKHFEERLRSLKEKLLLMGHKAEAMVADSICAHVERRPSLAEEVIQRDREIDLLEREIDEHCLEILALDQPVANDLRLLTSAFKIVNDLERIGDHAEQLSCMSKERATIHGALGLVLMAKVARTHR